MTMLDLPAPLRPALDLLTCRTCGGPMTAEPDALSCRGCGTTYPVDGQGIVHADPGAAGNDNLAVRMGQWRWVARVYDRLWRTRALSMLTGEPFSVQREMDIVSGSLPVKNGRIFLDNACANGFYARRLARRFRESGSDAVIFAVDASYRMLLQAKKLATAEGLADRIVFVHARSETLPFSDGLFDGIVCGGSLNEFGSPDSVLRELRRVLEPRQGAFSLMFQVKGAGTLKAAGQSVLARILGLRILPLRDAVEMVRVYFDPQIRFQGGMIVMLRCISRVRIVDDEPELSEAFTAAEAEIS